MPEKFIDGLELAERAKWLREEVARAEADLRAAPYSKNPHNWRPSKSGKYVMVRPRYFGDLSEMVCAINGSTRAERKRKAREWIAAQIVAFDAEQGRKAEEAKVRIRRCYEDPAWGGADSRGRSRVGRLVARDGS